jgi:peptidoglycan/xylan/chitin deacetylase (PgdA/CDA1 family)
VVRRLLPRLLRSTLEALPGEQKFATAVNQLGLPTLPPLPPYPFPVTATPSPLAHSLAIHTCTHVRMYACTHVRDQDGFSLLLQKYATLLRICTTRHSSRECRGGRCNGAFPGNKMPVWGDDLTLNVGARYASLFVVSESRV